MGDERRLVEIIAPALRGLLADGSDLALVRFATDGTPSPESNPLRFEAKAGQDENSTIKSLQAAVGEHIENHGLPAAVSVSGLGVFESWTMGDRTGRAAGKVAVVTGAARGFGLEIAQSMAAEGACVALADVNVEGVKQAARDLSADHGAGCAIGVSIDVTDGESVANCLHDVVRHFGGFDVFVSNAGVVKAGSVKDQDVSDFQFVTDVNYKGYFLCTQHAAPVLSRQSRVKSGYRSDIIQINSKSGLVGSNRNGAYAGSKFGGVGLTQSFALELVEDGIKVNSICPGNFFDGPLWSDPRDGLFVQYLQSGKVPGAKTVEDVKRSYESKVPMGRGCRTADVMKAIFYLMDQEYETGQALPVTGGQVMLS